MRKLKFRYHRKETELSSCNIVISDARVITCCGPYYKGVLMVGGSILGSPIFVNPPIYSLYVRERGVLPVTHAGFDAQSCG